MSAADAQARSRALTPDRSFCVTAPAGSGKTELLTQRILALLPRVERPEQILAITFTRKAAAEMRERLVQKLTEAEQAKPVSAEHERVTRDLALAALEHARKQGWSLDPEQFNLRTIDSLCGDLTRQMPVTSALGGAVEVTDQDTPLFEQAVSDLMLRVDAQDATGEALRALLAHFDNNWSHLRDLLVKLLGRRGDWAPRLGLHHSPEESESAVRATVEHLISSVLAAARAALGADIFVLERLANVAAETLGLPAVALTTSADAVPSWRQAITLLLTGQNDWRSPKGVNKTLGFPTDRPEEKRELQDLLERLGDDEHVQYLREVRFLPVLSDQDPGWVLVLHLSHLLPVLLAHLLLVFQREGRVDYSHIALAAEDALGTDDNPTDIALRLDYQLEHVLVDEFQDTSDQQFRLLTRLTRGWAEHNASGKPQRTIFIVGDGMQSIYGFRYANVGLFLKARDEGIGGVTLEALTLSRNFRSQAGIVEWVNRVFATLLPAQDDPARGRARHVHADAVHDALPGSAVRSRLFPDDGGYAEAEFIADQIEAHRAQRPEASIAVLLRARSHSRQLIASLRARGIPFIGRDLESLQSTPAVMDLLTLCRWLANPADDIASLALLRAPWCGLELADIQTLLADQPRPIPLRSVLRTRSSQLERDAAARAVHVQRALDWAASRRDRMALAVWVEQTWLRLGGNRVLGASGLADAERFFDLLRRADAEGVGLDIDWLRARLQQLFAEHLAVDNPVELMTLHKSKGLQFDVVFMPCLGKSVRGNERELLRWHLHTRAGEEGLMIAANDRRPKGEPSLYNYLNWLQGEKDDAELRRLLYVGVTRARHRVYLTGEVSAEKQWPNWPAKRSPMGVFCQAMSSEIEFAEATNEVAPEEHASSLLTRLASVAFDSGAAPAQGDGGHVDIDKPALYRTGNLRERAVGTVLHRALELLSQRSHLPDVIDQPMRAAIVFGLRREGLAGPALAQACTVVEEQLSQVLADSRGRWLLTAHPGAASELALVAPGGEGQTRIIDRTFIDPDSGVRWIVDYKTSQPSSHESVNDFVTREAAHYAEQLQQYRELMRTYDQPPREIMTALYFPALALWHPVV